LLSPGFSACLIRGGWAGARNKKEESVGGGLENRYKMVICWISIFKGQRIDSSGWYGYIGLSIIFAFRESKFGYQFSEGIR